MVHPVMILFSSRFHSDVKFPKVTKPGVLVVVQDEVLYLIRNVVAIQGHLDKLVGNRAVSAGEVKPKHHKVSISFASLSDQMRDNPSMFLATQHSWNTTFFCTEVSM